MPYPVRPRPVFESSLFGKAVSLQLVAAFEARANAHPRQLAIEYAVSIHGFARSHTTHLRYDATLRDKSAQNVKGVISVGPSAYGQDFAWLANIVFHELIHSYQHAYYVARGIPHVDPARSDAERLILALDEYEAYWWSCARATALGLSPKQLDALRDRKMYKFIDLDDEAVRRLVKTQQFDAARDALIKRYRVK